MPALTIVSHSLAPEVSKHHLKRICGYLRYAAVTGSRQSGLTPELLASADAMHPSSCRYDYIPPASCLLAQRTRKITFQIDPLLLTTPLSQCLMSQCLMSQE